MYLLKGSKTFFLFSLYMELFIAIFSNTLCLRIHIHQRATPTNTYDPNPNFTICSLSISSIGEWIFFGLVADLSADF